jgi:hypothetical protein
MIPAIRVTFPGFQPLTEETRKCFGSIAQSEQVGCTSIEFRLFGRGLTTREMFENIRKTIPDVVARPEPFGYAVYDEGPAEARIENYVKEYNNTFIFFYCMLSDYHGTRGAVCDDGFQLDDGNFLQFFARYNQIEYIPEIEEGMRRLMAGFVVKERQ